MAVEPAQKSIKRRGAKNRGKSIEFRLYHIFILGLYVLFQSFFFLSLALLLGLGLNYVFGFWQADPIVGLLIVIYLFREGVESWKDSKEE